jgi:hypothetical protein
LPARSSRSAAPSKHCRQRYRGEVHRDPIEDPQERGLEHRKRHAARQDDRARDPQQDSSAEPEQFRPTEAPAGQDLRQQSRIRPREASAAAAAP